MRQEENSFIFSRRKKGNKRDVLLRYYDSMEKKEKDRISGPSRCWQRFSISSIVRTGTLLNRLRAGTESPFSSLMVLSFIKKPPYFLLRTVTNAAIEISSAMMLMIVDNGCIIFRHGVRYG